MLDKTGLELSVDAQMYVCTQQKMAPLSVRVHSTFTTISQLKIYMYDRK